MSIQYLGAPYEGKPTVIAEPGKIPTMMLRHLPKGLTALGRFMSNGARYYVDVGEHVEWATPECDSFEDIIAYELAGEQVALHGLDRLVDAGIIYGYRLHKRVRDSIGTVWGDHENYQIPRELDPADPDGPLQPALATFLAARSILLGAGMVNGRGSYLCAQKAFSLEELASDKTTRARPLIGTRDEPHDDKEKYRRLHLIGGDANVQPWSIYMKVGMTAVLLRMVQEKVDLSDLALANAVYAGRKIAADPTGKTEVELANGKQRTATQLLAEIGKRAAALRERCQLPPQEEDVIEKWEWACDRFENGRDDLFRKSDMVTKHILYTEWKERHPRSRMSREEYITKLQALDLDYGIIGARYGKKGKRQHGSGVTVRQKSDYDFDKASRAVTEAPATTRACLRAKAIRNASNRRKRKTTGIGWDFITFEGHPPIKLSVRQTESEQLERLLS